MPSVQYFNRTAPFWDFVANLEDQSSSHPFFAGNPGRGEASDNENEHHRIPWVQGWSGIPWGPHPYRDRRGHHGPPHHQGPPSGPPQDEGQEEVGSSEPKGPPPPFSDSEDGPHAGRRGRHGHHEHHGHGPHRGPGARGGACGRGRGWGGRGRPFAPYAMGPFGYIAEMFQDQLFGEDKDADKSEDFKPEADVFDTPEAFVIHVSLPGAKKEDVGVNWDAEKSELDVAGVIYRPGDEELLNTLALNERKVGAFERKIRLGSRANPAQVDIDAISAKMEDGILRVEVPKLDAGYVEIKKVDIE